jgi:hypothetical protein
MGESIVKYAERLITLSEQPLISHQRILKQADP